MPESQGSELAKVAVPTDLVGFRNPDAVLDEGTRAATALKRVIASKPKPVIINNETYLEFEDWSTIGQFYNHSVRIVSDEFITVGDARGWEATADVLDPNGNVVSTAKAMCLNDEDRWAKRPQFQIRSMAQTRACAKAYRFRFSWVAVLAGYRPTPAEEMDGIGDKSGGKAANATTTTKNASEKMIGKIHVLMTKLGVDKDEQDRRDYAEVALVIPKGSIPSLHGMSMTDGMKLIEALEAAVTKVETTAQGKLV